MCGVAAIVGSTDPQRLDAMLATLRHRGPDDRGTYRAPDGSATLGHRRLSIIDLSPAGRQPMSDPHGRIWLSFNGEIYNYRELRDELEGDWAFRSQTDSEVLLAAWSRWGPGCLDRLLGMFAFVVWDRKEETLWAVRDRFGVKPLYYHHGPSGELLIASEIKALHAAGVPREPDPATWATYLAYGYQDHSCRTFWADVRAVPAGGALCWRDGTLRIDRWYELQETMDRHDPRSTAVVRDEALHLMTESVRLRFRSDVPVGINLSGGIDSSLLLGLVHRVFGDDNDVRAFTFVTNDDRYDELPWVQRMVEHTRHPLVTCELPPGDVPALAESVWRLQEEPFGGVPTLAYARLFERARDEGVVVLLDGQGLDEQWAGYDYYLEPPDETGAELQGSSDRPLRPEALLCDFRATAEPLAFAAPLDDPLTARQLRDLLHTKLPRALRFNDRISMRVSLELREPFLDHRLVELALRQAPELRVRDGVGKWLVRQLARQLMPRTIAEAPKRPVQTPQREWLRGPLQPWASDLIEAGVDRYGGLWVDRDRVLASWQAYRRGDGDNSFFVWQWVSLGMLAAFSGQDATDAGVESQC